MTGGADPQDGCLVTIFITWRDMDIVGNVEEHYSYEKGKPEPKTSIHAVVWFENPLK